MSEVLKISNIGYTANNNPLRAIRSGEEFGGIIPAPDYHEVFIKRNPKLEETTAEMQKLIRTYAWQTKELSNRLLGKDLYTTCGNIWKFLFSHIKYKEDDENFEQLRTPALSWSIRTSRGIDCDDFSTFAGTILYNLNIPFYLRCARYPKVDHFQHVYVVVPQKGKKYITIDAVLDQYDTEKPPAEIKDFLVMDNNKLNGLELTILSGVGEDDMHNELSGIIEGIDFEGIDEGDTLQGDEDQVLGAIYKHLVRTRNAVKKNPQIISSTDDPQVLGDMLDYGIKYWHTDKQDEALGILEEKENEINMLNGLDGAPDGYEETQLFYGIEGLGGVSVLGKTKVKKEFFKNVKATVTKVKQATKQAVKKPVQKINKVAKKVTAKIKTVAKKAGKAIVKNNPYSITARAGTLVAMKTNLFKIAERLKWGYLTEAEAIEHNLDLDEWRKSKTSLTEAEKRFVEKLKGKAEDLKKAILTGRAGGLNGLPDELGVVAATAAASTLAAATPFLKQLVDLVKAINPAKMTAKSNKKKLAKNKKQAETMPEVPEEAESAQPDAEQPASEETEAPEETGQNSEETESEPAARSSSPGTDPEPTPEENEEQQAGTNTPTAGKVKAPEQQTQSAPTEQPATESAPAPPATKPPEEKSVFSKIGDWVMDNKGYSALIVGTLVLAFTTGSKTLSKTKNTALGRAPKKGKTNKGGNKKNPPKAISGLCDGETKKKPKDNHKPKFKNKPRGDSPKRITL